MTQDHRTGRSSFSLVDDPWVRVRFTDGALAELSVREVFRQARRIERLAGETPQQDFALLRLLLVVFWRAHRHDLLLQNDDAEDHAEWWAARFSDEGDDEGALEHYLDEVAPRWDLLDARVPFMQVADLQTAKGEHSDITKLVPDAESPYFSVRAGRELDVLDFAEAARWLVHLQAWSYSGIKSGALGDPRVTGGKGYPIGTGWSGRAGGVVLHGRTLAETLVLNTVPALVFTEDTERDLPVWEREPDTAAPRSTERATGPADLLTWQIRRVRLFHDGGKVTGVLVANGDRLESQDELSDPMTAYRRGDAQSKAAGRDVWMPRRHAAERTLWRGIEPLLARAEDASGAARPPRSVAALPAMRQELVAAGHPVDDLLVTVELVGMEYGTQDAVVVATLREDLPLRLAVLLEADPKTRRVLIDAARATMEAAIDFGRFSGALRQAAGGEYFFDTHATASALAEFNEPFKAWLATVTPGHDAAEQLERWIGAAERGLLTRASAAVAAAGPRAVVGREDDDGRLLSAASAHAAFRRRLAASLGRETPRAGRSTSPALPTPTERTS